MLRAVALLLSECFLAERAMQRNKETHVVSFLNCSFISIYSSNSVPLSGIEDCLPPHFFFLYFNDINSSESRIKSCTSYEELLSRGICISLPCCRFRSCVYTFQQDDMLHVFSL